MSGIDPERDLWARTGSGVTGSASSLRRAQFLSELVARPEPEPAPLPSMDATATGDTGDTEPEAPPTHRPRWPWWLLALLVGLLVLAFCDDDDDDDEPVTDPTTATTDPSVPTDDGFGMLGLTGDVPREFDTQTTWLVDRGLDQQTTQAIRSEFDDFLRVEKGGARPGDTNAFGVGAQMPISSVGLKRRPQPGIGTPAQVLAQVLTQLDRAGDTGRAVVVVTSRPQAWTSQFETLPYESPDPALGHPEVRLYVINPVSGDTDVRSLTLDEPGPHVIDANPAQPGQIANALAIAWADNAGAGWS